MNAISIVVDTRQHQTLQGQTHQVGLGQGRFLVRDLVQTITTRVRQVTQLYQPHLLLQRQPPQQLPLQQLAW